MSLDIEKRIKNIEEIVEENNRMLHKIRRREIFNFWFGIVKILVLLGVFYYGYTLIEPYLQELIRLYSSFKETVDSAKEVKEGLNVGIPGVDVEKFLEGLKSN